MPCSSPSSFVPNSARLFGSVRRARPGCGLLLVAVALAACGAAQSDPVTPAAKPASAQPSVSAPAAPSLPPLSAEEKVLATELESNVTALTALGQRNVADPLRYADATDWISGKLEGMGYSVEHQGFVVGEELAQNLIVHTPGLRLGWERIVVVARMDSARGSVGADDNASGVAALLSLAQRYFGKRTLRTIDWVWLADAGGRENPSAAGAPKFLELAKEKTATLRAMVELNGLGAYADAPGSQRYSDELPGSRPSADFVAWVSYPEHAAISDRFGEGFSSRASLPVQHFIGSSDAPPVALSAQWAFLEQGVPSVLVYDTQQLRYADFGTAKDTAERLDYERMARATLGVHDGVLALAGGFGEAPVLSEPPALSEPTSGG
jgi:Peptidase family M28